MSKDQLIHLSDELDVANASRSKFYVGGTFSALLRFGLVPSFSINDAVEKDVRTRPLVYKVANLADETIADLLVSCAHARPNHRLYLPRFAVRFVIPHGCGTAKEQGSRLSHGP